MTPRTTDCALCPVPIPHGTVCWIIDSGDTGRLADRVTVCNECHVELRRAENAA